jgi:hypothetical protein
LPSEEELAASGNIEAFKPEPEQEDDNEGPVVEEVETTTEEENEEGGGEARSKGKSGSSKKPENKG